MIPIYDNQGVTIYHSHSLFVLMGMPSDSVDSIVTDPPYGLSFMGKKWDYDVPSVQIWAEALRVLKPGGHLLSFAGSRTYHRMAVNIEDAGFEIRDQIMWIYGSGFPKSMDISKAIDKAAGVEREVVGLKIRPDGSARPNKENWAHGSSNALGGGKGLCADKNSLVESNTETAPATPKAKQWDGWGTALKPAHEPIVVARKPLSGTVAENVLKHGTGGINIDGGRIGTNKRVPGGKCSDKRSEVFSMYNTTNENSDGKNPEIGRFPANIILDAEAGAMLDKQSGDSASGGGRNGENGKRCYIKNAGSNSLSGARSGGEGPYYDPERDDYYYLTITRQDSGGACRFFYCAKASRADRDEGLEGMAEMKCAAMDGNLTDGQRLSGQGEPIKTPVRANHHPTVKPTDLMQYLCRLVTPPGGTVLDPFMGSGSTGKAAIRERFKFIGIERETEYIEIAIARINAPAQVGLL